MASAREKALECILYIHYLVQFEGTNENQVPALIDPDSEINTMTPAYASTLGL